MGIHLFFGGQSFFSELKQAFQVIYLAGEPVVFFEPFFTDPDFALYGLGAAGVIPEIGVEGLVGEVLYLS